MKRINTLFYCTFFDNRNQQSVLDKGGLRLCLLINSKDFSTILHLGITIIISVQFHDEGNTFFDDMDISYENALLIARTNVNKLLSTLS